MSARETPELLLLVVRLVQAEGYDGQLSPIPMDGAPLLRPCQSVLPNPSAIAEFQATTRGTATQTIKALEAGGFLVRRRSAADGRSVSLRLSDKGNEAVARDPFEVLVSAVNSLDVAPLFRPRQSVTGGRLKLRECRWGPGGELSPAEWMAS